jgi:hypothetical protein
MNTIEIYDGGYSDEQRELDQALAQVQAAAKAERAAARQAVLAKLGISAEEADALLG